MKGCGYSGGNNRHNCNGNNSDNLNDSGYSMHLNEMMRAPSQQGCEFLCAHISEEEVAPLRGFQPPSKVEKSRVE